MLTEIAAALAAAGGTAVVEAMATDAWESARSGIARLLGCGDDRHRREIIEAQLDEDAAMLERADPGDSEQVRQELEPVWRRRLATHLDQHPEALDELRELVEQVRDRLPGERRTVVNNQFNVVRDHATGNIVQGGDQHIYNYLSLIHI